MALNNASQITLTIVTLAVSLVVISSVLAPVAQDVIDDFTAKENGSPVYENGETWAGLVGIVVLLSILALVLVAINGYTKSK